MVGLVGRIPGDQLGTLFGGPCRELLAFMDKNIKSGDFQDFPSPNPYWGNDYDSRMARVQGCEWFGQYFCSKCSAFMDLNIKVACSRISLFCFPTSGWVTVPS